eukprot:366546-Chlamydomonas_euryale.AAC.4
MLHRGESACRQMAARRKVVAWLASGRSLGWQTRGALCILLLQVYEEVGVQPGKQKDGKGILFINAGVDVTRQETLDRADLWSGVTQVCLLTLVWPACSCLIMPGGSNIVVRIQTRGRPEQLRLTRVWPANMPWIKPSFLVSRWIDVMPCGCAGGVAAWLCVWPAAGRLDGVHRWHEPRARGGRRQRSARSRSAKAPEEGADGSQGRASDGEQAVHTHALDRRHPECMTACAHVMRLPAALVFRPQHGVMPPSLRLVTEEDLAKWERMDDVIMGGISSSSFELLEDGGVKGATWKQQQRLLCQWQVLELARSMLSRAPLAPLSIHPPTHKHEMLRSQQRLHMPSHRHVQVQAACSSNP